MSARLEKLLFPAWGVAQTFFDWVQDSFLGFLTGKWAGSIFLALSVFLSIQLVLQPHRIKERVITKVERQIEKAAAKEVVRVERQMVRVRVRSADDVKTIAQLKATNAQLLQRIRDASSPYDSNMCIDADGVRQLSDLSKVLRDPGH